MMKKKIVIKVQIDCDKCRKKAMKIASTEGVDSVAMEGEDRDRVVVVGAGVDPANLTTMLRKKLGRHAEILSVEDVKEKEKEKKEEKKEEIYQTPQWYDNYYNYPPCRPVYVSDVYSPRANQDNCSIM